MSESFEAYKIDKMGKIVISKNGTAMVLDEEDVLALTQVINSAKKKFGCHCDLDPGKVPDSCVIDSGDFADCIHAKPGMKKEYCQFWSEIKD